MSKYASRGKVLFTKPTAPSLHIEITREREERRAVEGENARRKKRRAAGVKAEEKKRRAEERRAANVRATKRLTIGKSYMNLQEKLYEFAGKVCMHLEEKFNSNIADLAQLQEIDGQRAGAMASTLGEPEKGIRKTQWTVRSFRAQGDGSEPREQGNQEEVLRKRNQSSRLTAEEKGKGKL
ncbi:hypothetical protein Sjap_000970 [Stephania japonica]|uniref:Uncharacterized protein n=1 Tax=Stephania japonica TaxID=461633 RepID=A0AAP0PSW7_9MAGN